MRYSLKKLVKGFFELGLGDHADNLIGHIAVFEKHQGRDGFNA